LEKKQAVVIGAGFAGLAAASLMAKKGLSVLLLEESSGPGGRARVLEKDGYTLEYGVHSFRYAEQSSAHKIMVELGGSPEWIRENHRSWMIKGKDLFPIPGGAEKIPEDAQKYFHRPEIEKVKNAVARLVLERPEKFFRKSLADYFGDLLEDEKALLMVKLIGLQLMEPDPARLSAGELIVHLRRAYEAGVGSGHLKGSSKVLIDKMVSAVIENGGEIKYRNRALALEIEKGRVASVDTSEGEIEPEAVVYAGPLHQFFRIAAAEHFPEKLVKRVKRMEPVAGVAMDFGLREKVCETKGWFIDPEQGIMGRFPSNSDPGLAPGGKQLSSWLITVPWEKIFDPEAARSAIHRLRSQIKRLFPDFAALADWERILVLPVIDGAALTSKQSMPDRPAIQAPGIPNLFFAGDIVAVPGASGEIALRSGIEVSEKCASLLGKEG
jgi:phytoene dehydrogenase-like protein